MNTHAGFVRLEGQRGYVVDADGYRFDCMGWQTASEVGVDYIPHARYKDYY